MRPKVFELTMGMMVWGINGAAFDMLGASELETVKDGLVDEGWKDTVLVMPGERVRILLRFDDYAGLFLYHCHMLKHEDSGLMRNYRIVA